MFTKIHDLGAGWTAKFTTSEFEQELILRNETTGEQIALDKDSIDLLRKMMNVTPELNKH